MIEKIEKAISLIEAHDGIEGNDENLDEALQALCDIRNELDPMRRIKELLNQIEKITLELDELVKPQPGEISMILQQYADNGVEGLGNNTLLMCLDTLELRQVEANS